MINKKQIKEKAATSRQTLGSPATKEAALRFSTFSPFKYPLYRKRKKLSTGCGIFNSNISTAGFLNVNFFVENERLFSNVVSGCKGNYDENVDYYGVRKFHQHLISPFNRSSESPSNVSLASRHLSFPDTRVNWVKSYLNPYLKLLNSCESGAFSGICLYARVAPALFFISASASCIGSLALLPNKRLSKEIYGAKPLQVAHPPGFAPFFLHEPGVKG